MKPTHILVRTYQASFPNPYYSSNNSNIETTMVEITKNEATHFYSVAEVKSYIEKYPEVLQSTEYTFYKVDEIRPTRTVTIDVSL